MSNLRMRGHRLGLLVAEGGPGDVEHRGQILRRKIVAQLAQHVHEDVNRRRRQPGLGRHGPLPRHGVIGAEDERHGVDQINAPVRGDGLRCRAGRGFSRFAASSRFEGAAGEAWSDDFLRGGNPLSVAAEKWPASARSRCGSPPARFSSRPRGVVAEDQIVLGRLDRASAAARCSLPARGNLRRRIRLRRPVR